MWKPGDRVVKVAMGVPRGGIRLEIDTLGTVTDMPITSENRQLGCDVSVRIDDGREKNTLSYLWRPIDTNDSTGITSVEQLKRSLTKPKVVA